MKEWDADQVVDEDRVGVVDRASVEGVASLQGRAGSACARHAGIGSRTSLDSLARIRPARSVGHG